MLKEVPFGEWAPDLAPSHSEHLVIAQNVLPIGNGYAPARGFAAVTPTLGGAFTGGGSFVASDGSSFLLAGVAGIDHIKRYEDSAWTALLTGVPTDDGIEFAQFGDNLMFTSNGSLFYYNMISASTGIAPSAPTNCIDVARVRDFVMVLTDDDQVVWSEFNDALGWTTGTNQSDFQPLLGGGKGVAIVGGEYGIVLQKESITRVTYVGEPQGVEIIFQFDEISPEIGCMARGSVCNVGRLIFFLSERGFEMCDGESVVPIADEKFNRWFFANHSRGDIASMTSAIDPQNSLVMWAMPGNPGRIIVYNWVLKRGTVITVPLTAIFTGFSAAISLEDVDTLYPSGLDDVPVSLDDPLFNGGNPALLVVDNDNVIGTLVGDNLEATVRQKNVEPTKGRRSRLRVLRPVTDATTAGATVSAKMRAGDAEDNVTASSMRLSGKLPIRANGRYFDLTLTIPEGEDWSYLQGCEWEFESGDNR